MTNSKLRAILYVTAAAAVLTGCGADDVASPGEGNVVIITPPSAPPPPPAPTPTPTPTSPTTGPAASCPSGTTSIGLVGPNDQARGCQLPNQISGTYNVQNLAGVVYAFSGRVEVGRDVGGDGAASGGAAATLNIEAGVTLFAQSQTSFIVVNRGSRMNAVGEATKPIIFTSQANVEGTATDRDYGQWGGILLLGRGPISNCLGTGATGGSASCQQLAEGAGPTDFYGGNQSTDNSGTIQYIQIRYTGRAASPNNELQGLTLAGVGSGTILDYIQSHNSGDDGIEIFGGTANLRHLILTGADDDSYDTDLGFTGTTQFVIGVQNPGFGDRMWEIDSEDGAEDATPRQDTTLANFTFIQQGRETSSAITARGGPDITLLNGVVKGPNTCLDIDSAQTVQATGPDENGPPRFRSVVFDCDGGAFNGDSDTFEADSFSTAAGTNNNADFTTSLQSVFINGANENGVTAVANIQSFSPFLQQVDYIGAVKDANDTWYRSWSCNASYVGFNSPFTCANSPLSDR
jgi:hypothetical protein